MSAKEYTAKSVEEALEKALNEMMLTRDDIDYEVVQQPSKGFLGFGQKDAVVRVNKKVIEEVKGEVKKVEPVVAPVMEPVVETEEVATVDEIATETFVQEVEEDIYEAISMKTCVEKRMTIGAPSAEAMKQVIEIYKKELAE